MSCNCTEGQGCHQCSPCGTLTTEERLERANKCIFKLEQELKGVKASRASAEASVLKWMDARDKTLTQLAKMRVERDRHKGLYETGQEHIATLLATKLTQLLVNAGLEYPEADEPLAETPEP